MEPPKTDVVGAADIESDEYLANVVWASLSEAPQECVERFKGGARYRREFAPFGAAREYSAESVAQIAAMLPPGQSLILFTAMKPEIPSGYAVTLDANGHQMIAEKKFRQSSDARVVRLGPDDVSDMLQLVEITRPGPFNSRTNELGNFFGIREKGRLVAMAGERMAAGRHVEVSAVCTHPDWRGKGLGRLLVEHVSASIQQHDRIPFLHVFTTNTPAIRLYRELGFRIARTLHVTAIVHSPAGET
ncbi:FR47-like protein [Paraburkholderia sp. GV068]|jgi:ribosomal protein S18 acetylase RimI-like enzyme|uniref:GCN5-related N-acetyltransferase n=1 Tax=Paraburkholderia graminis (strain ATCC 700544 / DSM 17151 / LMG 18924 / NCIMB 13744 / C4D1M) TaxID=396598 RepID=B1FUI6_PARG4|nr:MULTISPECIES: GNAT family N-acetyltransferase [Paraburkholderia]EDT12296.1 GCN5-related N-acetyltransferase [Paraburkholderia graminis C4D1M]PTQ99115.1 FR47-like protein [Paraburkholderia sp. GV072]PUB04607.1 FR47-like protein [Paraburkholderia sp. GV068]CAB3720390.1 Mycothiol acetyltransferase [Paraburkholderia graminis C4D1M]